MMNLAVTAAQRRQVGSLQRAIYDPSPPLTPPPPQAMAPFPKPLNEREAGPNLNGDRRYLWTDAFGTLNFISQAMTEKQENLKAAKSLIDAVHNSLGHPRSNNPGDAMLPDLTPGHEGDFIGLRIGKMNARSFGTDYGMEFDGCYFHYFDKWLYTLYRLLRTNW